MGELSHKACSKCGETKALADFARDARNADGHRSDCKTCNKAKSRDYALAHQAEIAAYQAEYRTRNADRIRRQKQVRYAVTRSVRSEANRVWREANRDRLREQQRDERDGIRALVFAHYGQACACCGASEKLTIDHVNGGGSAHRLKVLGRKKIAGWVFYKWLIANNFPADFQVLCFPCNRSKGTGESCRLEH